MLVRRACPRDDAGAIGEVVAAVHAAGFPVASPAGLLAELASRPGREVAVWLAHTSDAPVGVVAAVAAGTDDRVRHSIAWLMVSPQARRRGVGAALAAAALAEARRRGAGEVWVETRADWTEAGSFWRALGFVPPG